MNILTRLPILLLFLSLFFQSCKNRQSDSIIAYPNVSLNGSLADAGNSQYFKNDLDSDEDPKPKFKLDSKLLLLKTINSNLDFDKYEEQIIIAKNKNNSKSKNQIIILDFDSVRNVYKISWKSSLLSNTNSPIDIMIFDIIGDHNLSIVCKGINDIGEQTIDVFRKTKISSGISLSYESICKIKSPGKIDIEAIERTPAYDLGQENGDSYIIVTYTRDVNSNNILDALKTSYAWDNKNERYIRIKSEKIPGSKISELQLKRLFNEDENAFKEFLNGPWYKSSGEEESATYQKENSIIYFNPFEERFIFYSNDIQEIYIWESSHKTAIPNSIYITGRNESIPFVNEVISISILSMTSISLSINYNIFSSENSQWNGTYYKLTEDIKLFDNYAKNTENQKLNLSGYYYSDDNSELFFDNNRFTFLENNKKISGNFSIYQLEDKYILTLVVINKSGFAEEKRTYRINYKKEQRGNEFFHIIELIIGKFSIYGFEEFSDQSKYFEQVETIENPE